MKSNEIINLLEAIEKSTKDKKISYQRILINGKWGIGKSHYIKKYVNQNEKNKNIIYISLFGKNNYQSIIDNLTIEVVNNRKKITNIFRTIKDFFNKNNLSVNIPKIGISIALVMSEVAKYQEILNKNNKNVILIVDDLERKSPNIPIADILGILENLASMNNVKLVIVADEDKIDPIDKEKWINFKEKLIERDYYIDSCSDDAIQNIIIEKYKNIMNQENLIAYIDEFTRIHNIKNLRTIIKAQQLFDEVYYEYLESKHDKEINLIVFSVCMAVVIEVVEKLHSKTITEGSLIENFINDSEEKKIGHYYFGSLFNTTREASIINYILKIYQHQMKEEEKTQFENTLKLLGEEKKQDKGIFYLSEQDIIKRINQEYADIISNQYTFVSKEKLFEEISYIFNFAEALNITIDVEKTKKCAVDILLNYMNDSSDDINNSKINVQIEAHIFKRNTNLIDIMNIYNILVEEKRFEYLLEECLQSYKKEVYNTEKIEELQSHFHVAFNSETCKEKVFNMLLKHNFLIPNFAVEITENMWKWINYIYTFINRNYTEKAQKDAFDIYINRITKKNKLAEYRVGKLRNIQ